MTENGMKQMTDEMEALNDFKVVEKTSDMRTQYETSYSKLAKALSVLSNERMLKIPLTYFKTKHFGPSIAKACKRLGFKAIVLKRGDHILVGKRL